MTNESKIVSTAEPLIWRSWRGRFGLFGSFLFILTFVNLIQATFTELLPDEAYYYMYSTRLAFGYFDHPPMIALLIKIGEFFTHSQFGVRVIPVLMNTATAYIMFKTCKPKDVQLFIFCYLNFIAFQALGFLAVPDIPLLFFTACFFYLYQQFLKCQSWKIVLLLSFCAAALIYSKYHGILVIGFVVLSNLKLFLNYKFYVIILLALLLLLPHIMWQINNDFPSIKYHLGYRFDGGVSLENIFGYIGGQLAFIGPVGVWCLLKCNYKIKNKDKFDVAVLFTALGFLVFFLASSFNGRIEANWTAAAFIPFIILVNESSEKINLRVVKTGAIVLILLMIPFRIYLMYDFLPAKLNYKYQRHGWQQWADNVKEKAKGAILVFQDSYQKTSMYTFYANEFSHSINSFGCRKSQFDLWTDYEDKIQGKTALTIPNWVNDSFDSIPSPIDEKMCCIRVNDYHSYSKLNFETDKKSYFINANDSLKMNVRVTAPPYVYSTLDINPKLLCYMSYRIFYTSKDSFADHISTTLLKPYLTADSKYRTFTFSGAKFEKGKYKIIFYGRVGTTESGYCKPIDLEVK